jgi:hypothetical protein
LPQKAELNLPQYSTRFVSLGWSKKHYALMRGRVFVVEKLPVLAQPVSDGWKKA